MPVVLFIIYLVILSFILTKSRFLLASKLKSRSLIILFLLYAFAGCLHVWIAYHFYPQHGDIWMFFNDGIQLKQYLLDDFPSFRKNIFPDGVSMNIGGADAGWAMLQHQTLILLNMAFNFLSFNNIYINTVFFCFFTFWGRIAFFRMLREMFPADGITIALVSLIIPSIIFWTTVIHKEGILFTVFGILLFSFWRMMKSRPDGSKILLTILCLALIVFTRSIVLVTLIPALAAWLLADKTALTKRYALAVVIGCSFLGLAALAALNPAFDIVNQLSNRQLAFHNLEGASRIRLPELENNWRSLANLFPYAAWNGLFMPMPGSGGKTIYSLFGFELIALWVIACLGIIYWLKGPKDKPKDIKETGNGFWLFCILFSVSGCLIIGYIVPFAGAIIRYRSIFLPFLAIPFIHLLHRHPFVYRLNGWLEERL